jgi:segregation and condensation protein B
MDNLIPIIEALLFVTGEPLTLQKLSTLCNAPRADIKQAVDTLADLCEQRGIRLLQKEETITLVTAPELSPYVEKLVTEEIMGELSKAALETLAIIAYRHPIVRSEIDYIRGVNSSFTIRNLIARGLIERSASAEGRGYQYRPTIEFMKFLGISSFEDLPEYSAMQKELTRNIENPLEIEA